MKDAKLSKNLFQILKRWFYQWVFPNFQEIFPFKKKNNDCHPNHFMNHAYNPGMKTLQIKVKIPTNVSQLRLQNLEEISRPT